MAPYSLTDSSSRMIPSHSSPLFRDAQVDIGHEGRPWWGSSRPSSRSPTGRGTPLNGVRRRFEACREHDAWHKAMCKRNIAKYGGIRRPRAKRRRKTWMPMQQQYSKKKRITPLEKGCRFFLNRSRHPPRSRSSAEQSRRVLTLWSWVRIPPGARDPHEYVNQFVPSCGSVE